MYVYGKYNYELIWFVFSWQIFTNFRNGYQIDNA